MMLSKKRVLIIVVICLLLVVCIQLFSLFAAKPSSKHSQILSLEDFNKEYQTIDTKKQHIEDSVVPTFALAIVFHDVSDFSQKSLVSHLQTSQWRHADHYIITHAPHLTKELLRLNAIPTSNIHIVTNHIPQTSMEDKLGKGSLYKIFETFPQVKTLIYFDHREVSVERILTFYNNLRSKCSYDLLFFKNTEPSSTVLSSKLFILDRGQSKEFLRLWANFMEMFSFHKQSNDETALDFTFKAEGYSDIGSLTSKKKNPLNYCLIHYELDYVKASSKYKKVLTVEYKPDQEPRPDEYKGLVDMNNEPVDYLIAIKVVSCTAKQAVEHINKYHNPQRIIYMVVFPESCRTLLSFGENVRCIWENHSIPGFSKQVIQENSKHKKVKQRAGWYLLQIMNMHASLWEGLSEHYIVWDADGIPVRKMELFRNGKVVFYTGDEHDYSTSVGYHVSYRKLTGHYAMDPMDDQSPDFVKPKRPTWVAHFMVFKKEYVRALIDTIVEHRKTTLSRWMFEVVKVVNEHREERVQRVGFGEYDAYGSFVKKFYPESFEVEMDSWKTCARLMKAPAEYSKDCCVPNSALENYRKNGKHYIVREYDSGNCDSTESP